MADDQITLTIAKSDEPFDMPSLKYNHIELGKTVDVAVTDIDGKPYDLTNKSIVFIDRFTDSGKGVIIDNGSSDKSGSFVRTDDSSGKFKYVFQRNIYQGCGKAQFEFLSDGQIVDATNPFYIDIQIDLASGVSLDNATYISDLTSLEATFRATIDNASKASQSAIDDFRTKSDKALAEGQTNIDNQVKDTETKVNNLVDKTTTILNGLTTAMNTSSKELADMQNAWKTISKQIQDKATSEIEDVKSKFASQMDEIKANADKKLETWKNTNQEVLDQKANQTDLDSLADTVKTKASQSDLDNLTKTVNSKASQADLDKANQDIATKANKADVDKELSEYAKTTDVDTKLKDYETVSDASAELNKKADKTSLAEYDKSTDVDKKLADKANKSDLEDYAKSTEVDSKLADKADKTALNDYEKIAGVDAKLKDYATVKDTDDKLAGKADKTALADYEKATDADKKLAEKANQSDLATYAKTTDIDDKLKSYETVENSTKKLDAKADKSALDDYAKSADVDKKLASKADQSSLADYAKNADVDTKLKDYETTKDAVEKLSHKVEIKHFSSPQEAMENSSDTVIGIYDMNDGPTQAVVAGKPVTIETLYNSLNALQTEVANIASSSHGSGSVDPSALAEYEKITDLNAKLEKYVTSEGLKAELDKKVNTADYGKDKQATEAEITGKASQKSVDDLKKTVDQKADTTALADYEKTSDLDTKLAAKLSTVSLNGAKPIHADTAGNADLKLDLSSYVENKPLPADLADMHDFTKQGVYDVSALTADQLSKVKNIPDGATPTAIVQVLASKDGSFGAQYWRSISDGQLLAQYWTNSDKGKVWTAWIKGVQAQDLSVYAKATDVSTLLNQVSTLQSKNDALTQQVNDLKARKFIVHVKSVADVDKYPDSLVVVDDS